MVRESLKSAPVFESVSAAEEAVESAAMVEEEVIIATEIEAEVDAAEDVVDSELEDEEDPKKD